MQHTGQQSRKHIHPGCPSPIFYKDTGYNAMLIYTALSFSVPESIYEGCLLTFAAVTARTLSKKAFVKVLLKRPF
jgi:hypothetical protein